MPCRPSTLFGVKATSHSGRRRLGRLEAGAARSACHCEPTGSDGIECFAELAHFGILLICLTLLRLVFPCHVNLTYAFVHPTILDWFVCSQIQIASCCRVRPVHLRP